MNYAPIIIPTLNRYKHLKECVESLALCTHADKTDLYIGLDYPPSEKYVEGWRKVKEYVYTIKGFKSVTILERKENFGAAKNSIELRKYVFEKYDTVIYTEDDNVFSPCFLDYINKGLEKYKDDERVVAIGGYFDNELYNFCSKDSTIIKIKGTFNAWGYGCWKNKYQKLFDSIKPDYRRYVFSKKQNVIKLFARKEQCKRLLFWLEVNPKLDRPCDVTYSISTYINNWFIVYPLIPIVRNEGYDGTGINCGEELDNAHSNRMISNDVYYNFIDNFTEQNMLKYSKLWAKKLDKDFLSYKERIIIISFLFFSLFFDYKIVLKLLSVKKKMFKLIKHVLWRLYNCFAK